mmetsp:Transcript_33464/g.69119  ORF Transcript_33464/g.69119 Transcript_33464/m.69119 type:complete len:95 (+) Transcript_33464:358-642(+)
MNGRRIVISFAPAALSVRYDGQTEALSWFCWTTGLDNTCHSQQSEAAVPPFDCDAFQKRNCHPKKRTSLRSKLLRTLIFFEIVDMLVQAFQLRR